MELKVTVPTSWEDITLGQFIELRQLGEEKDKPASYILIEQLAILTDTDPEDLKKFPMNKIKEINANLDFVKNFPDHITFDKIIDIDGQKFGFVPDLNQLSGAEWIDMEMCMKDLYANLGKLLAILYRPLTSYHSLIDYEIEDYNSIRLEARSLLFNEKLSIVKVWGAAVFFWNIGEGFIKDTTESLNQASKEMSEITKDYLSKAMQNYEALMQGTQPLNLPK
jgi:hypothetical protein